jgi:hypothetical protein
VKLEQRALQFVIVIDQCLNVLIGSGYADETLSAYAHRTREKSPWRSRSINAVFFWQEDHCRAAWESERDRKHFPISYREAI